MATGQQDPAARVREMMERIARAAGVEATVEVREQEDGLHAEYIGDDLGLLIGHHGQTIRPRRPRSARAAPCPWRP
jgi:predicted RNA-binding protein Jag